MKTVKTWLGASTILGSIAVVTALYIFAAQSDRGAYALPDIRKGLDQHPAAWIGRVVAVRGYLFASGTQCSPGAYCSLFPRWALRPHSSTVAEWEELTTNSRSSSNSGSVLILRASPHSTRSRTLPTWVGQIPILGLVLSKALSPPYVYRIRLLPRAPCPSSPSSRVYDEIMCGPQGVRI